MAVSAARLAADSLRVLPRKRLSRLLGRVADLEGPDALVRRAVRAFVRVYDVDLSEAEVPDEGFGSFNEFFTRRLVPGARPVDPDPETVVSPADGRVEDVGRIAADARFEIKGRDYGVGELLGDPQEAARFEGGQFFVVYLSPRDYHRVHAAVSGPVRRVRHVAGTLYPVNAIGVEHVPQLFARNERVAVFQDSETHGWVATVMVGAMGVGRIGLSFDDVLTNRPGHGSAGLRSYGEQGPALGRGDELGVFHLGSTVLVFVGPGVSAELLAQPGAVVRVGRAIVRGSTG